MMHRWIVYGDGWATASSLSELVRLGIRISKVFVPLAEPPSEPPSEDNHRRLTNVGEYNSIQFGADGKPVSDPSAGNLNGDLMHRSIRDNTPPGDSTAIRVNVGSLSKITYGAGSGKAETRSATTSIQLRTDPGTVMVAGIETDPKTAERLKAEAPQLFEGAAQREARAQIEAEMVDTAQRIEAAKAELGKHEDADSEAGHTAFTSMPMQGQIAALVEMWKTGEPSAETMKRAGDYGFTAAHLEAMSRGTSAQYTAAAKANGVEDPAAAAAWARRVMPDTVMSVLQAHVMRRDVSAWRPIFDAYKRGGGK
jgi:hypothetical protein